MQTQTDLITIEGRWDFDYRYFAGATASRFFNELRDNRRIMGTRSAKDGRVLVPARSFSDADYLSTTEWVEVGPGGVLEVFTIIGTKFPGLPDPPFVVAYVTLDGGDTSILNHVAGLDLSDLNKAAERLMKRPRVKAVFKDRCEGRITDFHFVLDESK